VNGRRALAALASAALAALLLSWIPLAELRGRWTHVVRFAPRELAARRLGGSSTDFDRPYFILLEWARRMLPPDVRGVAVFPARPIPSRGAYLTFYTLAPVPALVAPENVPQSWLVLAATDRLPSGWPVIARTEGGALCAPPR